MSTSFAHRLEVLEQMRSALAENRKSRQAHPATFLERVRELADLYRLRADLAAEINALEDALAVYAKAHAQKKKEKTHRALRTSADVLSVIGPDDVFTRQELMEKVLAVFPYTYTESAVRNAIYRLVKRGNLKLEDGFYVRTKKAT